jgi:DNA adenine methylase
MRRQMPRATVPRQSARVMAAPRPLLKWAGGKRQLLPAFRAFYPETFRDYFEPFLGSGAVFFDLCAQGRLAGSHAHLADRNADLIACYTAVRDAPDAVLAALVRLAAAHAREGQACYYAVREQFNAARLGATAAADPAERAAMLMYLNRTGFNGLYRVNRRGAYNVPAGRYERPRIVAAARVRATAAALAAPGVLLARAEFAEAVATAAADDFVYFDPPYAPLSPTAAFGAYTAPRFGPDDQRALRDTAVALAGRGARVMLSNSSAPDVLTLYLEAAASGDMALWQLPARRAINSRPGGRGTVAEVMLTNLVPRRGDLPSPVVRLA